jgi:hypothetical protein
MRNPTISRREPPVQPRGEGRSLRRASREAWHTWHACRRDGEADERLKADFQRHMGVDTGS